MSEIEQIDIRTSIDSLYMLYCTSLLPLVILGIAFFYSGLTQRRSSLTMFSIPFLICPMIIIDWFIWGYSLTYSTSSNHYIGNLSFAVLRSLKHQLNTQFTNSRGSILLLSHFLFNMFFKLICAALTFPGCIAERGRILPMLLFLFIWSVIIYNPVTYWFWNENGWLSVDLNKLPVLDFAGGNCVHIVSGFTCLAYSYILGPRNPKILYNYRNLNTSHIIIGMSFVLFGWIGFMAGCEFKFSYRSLFIITNTILAATSSGIIWTAIDFWFSSIPLEGELQPITSEGSKLDPVISETGVLKSQRYHETKSNFIEKKKFSMISFSSGIMAGLVVFTPAGGYISSNDEFWKPIVFGVVGAIICNISTRLKYFFQIDDALDIFAIHGVAGIVGSLLTGLFANKSFGSEGGWIHHHWKQFGYQTLGVVITSCYVFIMSLFFLYLIDLIPGLHLRIDKNFNKREREKEKVKEEEESQINETKVEFWEQVELQGTDAYEFNGEFMMDFIEFIKVIRPQDYEDDTFQEVIEGNFNTSYQSHETNLTKRD
ncbi:unnamed protein product [Candida verbasci]|uniref:Ammonium transporter AmtB-like domain-containing protein n=1 Tax=Candida verbasci TaxID=1227364 RepID=A0A9W4TT76_9ASCO|nr:unnamed protein product [Candida verbasci]